MHGSAKVQKTDFSPIMAKFARHEKVENRHNNLAMGDVSALPRTGLRADRLTVALHHCHPTTIGCRFLHRGQNILLPRPFKR